MARQNANKVGFQYLTGLINECQTEMFDGKDEGLAHHHRRSAHDEAHVCEPLSQVVQLGMVINGLPQEMTLEAWVTAILVAQTDKIEAFVAQHATNLIHGTVGIGHEKNVGIRVFQLFQHHIAQSHRRLTRAWRSHQQEIVLCLFGFQHHVIIVRMIASGQCEGVIDSWFTLSQQQVAPLFRGSHQRMQGMYG